METSAPTEKGRRAALAVFMILVGLEIVVLITYLLRVGPGKLLQHTVRLAIAAWLGWALVRGRAWARVVILILVALAVLVLGPSVGVLWTTRQLTPAILLTGFLAAYVIAAGILLFSRELRDYLRAHKPTV